MGDRHERDTATHRGWHVQSPRSLLRSFFLAENRLPASMRLTYILLFAIAAAILGDAINILAMFAR